MTCPFATGRNRLVSRAANYYFHIPYVHISRAYPEIAIRSRDRLFDTDPIKIQSRNLARARLWIDEGSFSYLLTVRAIYAGFWAFYTACLGLCDVHVSKGRLLLFTPPPAPGPLSSLLWSSTQLRISLARVPSTIYACCILHNKALDFKEVHASRS